MLAALGLPPVPQLRVGPDPVVQYVLPHIDHGVVVFIRDPQVRDPAFATHTPYDFSRLTATRLGKKRVDQEIPGRVRVHPDQTAPADAPQGVEFALRIDIRLAAGVMLLDEGSVDVFWGGRTPSAG